MQHQSPDNNDRGELNKLRLLVSVMMMVKDLVSRDVTDSGSESDNFS